MAATATLRHGERFGAPTRPHAPPRPRSRVQSHTPDLVIRTYHQEVIRQGRRGACRRAGDRLGLTDERVRQIVKADEAERQLLFVLAYVKLRPWQTPSFKVADCQTEREPPPPRPFTYVPPFNLTRHNQAAETWRDIGLACFSLVYIALGLLEVWPLVIALLPVGVALRLGAGWAVR